MLVIGLTGCAGPTRIAPADTSQAVVATIAPASVTPPTAPATAPPTQTLAPLPTATAAPAASPRLIGYFYGGNPRNRVSNISKGMLADIIYAFVDINAGGECAWMDPARDSQNIAALQKLRAQQPGLRLLFSVGGYENSGRFSDVAASAARRQRFAASCVGLLRANNLDGIDIDWEYPVRGGKAGNAERPQDKENLTALLAELRAQLSAQEKVDGRIYLLAAAAPAGAHLYANYDLGKMQAFTDWITLMAYDFYTGGSPTAQLAAGLYPAADGVVSGDAAVAGYLSQGVAADKIALGVPFYGRAWRGVTGEQNGLGQPASGPYRDAVAPAGTWGSGGEIEFRALAQNYLGHWPRFWQASAQAPWLYNAAERVLVSYDDAQSLGIKADYAREKHLGGIAIWQISSDDDAHTLLTALRSHLVP